MMDVVHYMNNVAVSARLSDIIAEFEAAVAARDPQRIAAADFALRNAALAVIGSMDAGDADAPATRAVLQDVILMLRHAACALAQDAQRPQASLGQQIYMRLGAESTAP